MKGHPESGPRSSSEQTVSSRRRGRTPRISQVGRYVLLKQLGEGGMGVVFAAYDPDLDRKVALKLLRPDGRANSEDARARLLREAQAMARVSHPNVIPIFDVGVWGEQVFLAMELIEGGTLGEWLRAGTHSWREVLERFLEAGRGLLAAHEAGLVHRDFKPGNVLVSQRGRVCVTDFGLARQVGKSEAEGASTPEELPPGSLEHRMLEVELTEPGLVMGTPNYMSPEQFMGMEVDARSDQFSFCVSLYWALYRRRPFDPDSIQRAIVSNAGGTTVELASTLTKGSPRQFPSLPESLILEPPRDTQVPAWIRQAVMRGLALDPDQRFASMRELLEALSQVARRERRRRWGAMAAVGAVGLSLVGGAVYQRSRVCVNVGDLMAEVWSLPARQRVEASFLATGRPFARDISRSVIDVLDGYARAWTQQRTEACEATRLRGVQTEELLSQREVCLERRRRDMRALVDQFHGADGPLVEKALEAAHALPVLQDCADVESLAERQRLPADPVKRAGIAALENRVAELKALVDTGRYATARQKVDPLAQEVEATGYLPLMAEIHTHRGWMKEQLGSSHEALEELSRAAYEAEAGRADRLKVGILTRLLFVEEGLGHFDAAERWGGWADATLRRMGGDPLLESGLLVNRGNLETSRDRHARAREFHEKARDLLQRTLPPEHPYRARVTALLGSTLVRMGEHEQGLALLREALVRTEAALGRLHPSTGLRHMALAWTYREMGNSTVALEHARAAVGIREALFGPDHPRTAEWLDEVGQNLFLLGRHAEALEVFQKALAAKLQGLKPGDEALQYSYDGVGQALLGLGRAREAIEPLQKAVSFTSMPPEVLADSGFALARALWADGRHQEALAEALEAGERFTQAGQDERSAEVRAWMAGLSKLPRGHVRRP